MAMGFIYREGLLETAIYSNSPDSDLYLDEAKATYIGGLLLLTNARGYFKWGKLEESLLTGKHQDFDDLFSNVYQS